jgi:hypothetical protein
VTTRVITRLRVRSADHPGHGFAGLEVGDGVDLGLVEALALEAVPPLGLGHDDVARGPELNLLERVGESRLETASADRRAARSAASLTRLARSAPVMPGVDAATRSRSRPAASGTRRVWTLRMATLPFWSGAWTTI